MSNESKEMEDLLWLFECTISRLPRDKAEELAYARLPLFEAEVEAYAKAKELAKAEAEELACARAEAKAEEVFASWWDREEKGFEALQKKAKEPITITLAEKSYDGEVDRLSKIVCPQCTGELGYQILNKDDYWNSRPSVKIRSHIVSLCPHGCGQKILLETKQVL